MRYVRPVLFMAGLILVLNAFIYFLEEWTVERMLGLLAMGGVFVVVSILLYRIMYRDDEE